MPRNLENGYEEHHPMYGKRNNGKVTYLQSNECANLAFTIRCNF